MKIPPRILGLLLLGGAAGAAAGCGKDQAREKTRHVVIPAGAQPVSPMGKPDGGPPPDPCPGCGMG